MIRTATDRTIPWLLLGLAFVACRPALPSPAHPLVATPTDDLVTPPVGTVPPPAFPRVSEVRSGGGALWYVNAPVHEGVDILVQSRRGEDGGHPRELATLTAAVLEEQLRQLLPQASIGSGADMNGSWIAIRTTRDAIDGTFAALSHVLDGDAPPESVIGPARELMLLGVNRSHHALFRTSMAAARDQLHGRGVDLEEGERALRPIVEGFGQTAVDVARRERFAAEDRVFIVTGAFDAPALRASFVRHLGTERPPIERRAAHPYPQVVPRHIVLSRYAPTPQVYVVFARIAPPPTHRDRLAYEMIVDLVGGTFGSQLNGSLRETHSYTYGAHAFISRARYGDVLIIGSAFEPTEVRGALETLFDQLRTVRSRRFSEDDIRGARNRLWAKVTASLQGAGLAAVLSTAWERRWVPRQLEARYAALADLTPAMIQEVAQRHFSSQKAILVLTGDFERVAGVLVERDDNGYHLR